MIIIRLTKKQIGKKGPLVGRSPILKQLLRTEGRYYHNGRKQGYVEVK